MKNKFLMLSLSFTSILHNFEFAKTLSATFEKFETTKSPKKHHQLKLLCCLLVIPDKTQEDKAKKVLIKIMNYNQLKTK